jgi:hypothetical protein
MDSSPCSFVSALPGYGKAGNSSPGGGAIEPRPVYEEGGNDWFLIPPIRNRSADIRRVGSGGPQRIDSAGGDTAPAPDVLAKTSNRVPPVQSGSASESSRFGRSGIGRGRGAFPVPAGRRDPTDFQYSTNSVEILSIAA